MTHTDDHLHDDTGRADALLMFGLTGDLGEKKLIPALVELAAAGELDLPVVAVGRSDTDADEIRARLSDVLADHTTLSDDRAAAEALDELDLSFVRGAGSTTTRRGSRSPVPSAPPSSPWSTPPCRPACSGRWRAASHRARSPRPLG